MDGDNTERTHRSWVLLVVILIFSGVSSMSIDQELVISDVRADSISIDHNNTTAFIIDLHDNTFTIISGQTRTVIGNPTVVGKYQSVLIFVSPSTRDIYVVNLFDKSLSIISGQTRTVIGKASFVLISEGQMKFELVTAKRGAVTASHVAPSSLPKRASVGLSAKTPAAAPFHPPLIP